MKEIIKKIKKFNKDREWDQFHSGSNIAKSIVIEAGELLEIFQWENETNKRDELKDELADVLIYCIQLADKYELDIKEIINEKISKNEKKYPVSKSKGNSKKYNEF